jgi:hypothetical protein
MGTTINGVFEGGKNLRRRNALRRLEAQLKSGKKPLESARLSERVMQDLTESDIKRIKKEIEILKSKI